MSSQTATELIRELEECKCFDNNGEFICYTLSGQEILTIIKAKRECWQEELETLETLNIGFIARYTISPSKRDEISEKFVEERIEELKKNLEMTEGKDGN